MGSRTDGSGPGSLFRTSVWFNRTMDKGSQQSSDWSWIVPKLPFWLLGGEGTVRTRTEATARARVHTVGETQQEGQAVKTRTEKASGQRPPSHSPRWAERCPPRPSCRRSLGLPGASPPPSGSCPSGRPPCRCWRPGVSGSPGHAPARRAQMSTPPASPVSPETGEGSSPPSPSHPAGAVQGPGGCHQDPGLQGQGAGNRNPQEQQMDDKPGRSGSPSGDVAFLSCNSFTSPSISGLN